MIPYMFELRQYESMLWFLRNMLRMRRKEPLFPVPNTVETEPKSDLEVISRCADIKNVIVLFHDNEAELDKEKDRAWVKFVEERISNINKVLRTVDSQIEEKGYLVLNAESKPYDFPEQAIIPPPQGASDPAYRPVHHALFQSSAQGHAFDWMCQLDRVLNKNENWLLPEPPPPTGHVSGLLYNFNEEIAGSVARITLRARHQKVKPYIYAYGFEVILPSLIPNIDLIEANLQAELETRRRRKHRG